MTKPVNAAMMAATRAKLGVSNVVQICASFDGQGSAVEVGSVAYVLVPFACTITGASILGDATGSAIVDVWIAPIASHPPTDANSVTGGAEIELSAAAQATVTDFSSWTVAIAANSSVAFRVDSCSTITRLAIQLQVTRA